MIETRCGLYTNAGKQVPLQGVEVDATVFGGHAQVRVRQRYRNSEAKAVEALYTFPLPSEANLTGFSMTCDGRRIDGEVKEREQAFREYDEAISSGHGAALLDQERPNVFTAQIGNLLPNEETLIEVSYLERVRVDEGQLRWSIPTLVAPRYIPGDAKGDRTGHGWAGPTDRVPDADRITPPIGDARYGLKLKVAFELGHPVRVESPSHAVTVKDDGQITRVELTSPTVALDRDVVLTARGVEAGPLTGVAAHRKSGEKGTFSLTLVPDLFRPDQPLAPQQVVFLIDVSGSMQGASIGEAKNALRLCLRHLREGDSFNVIAFDDEYRLFADSPVTYGQKTLEQADAWVQELEARGGTELLQPLVRALEIAPDGAIVLLTDGEVGNEDEILKAVLEARRRARVYSFGIGTNVSDVLLRDLARRSGGEVEFIHPGERIDEKVLAQFSRAIAPRVDEVTITFDGVEVSDLSPAPVRALVDGEPWVLFGRYDQPGNGKLELRGARYQPGDAKPEPFTLSIPVELPAEAEAPYLERLWAGERIRDLDSAQLEGRRAEAMRERLTKLAVEYGVISRFTSFVLIEKRVGARLSTEQPETRVVPVNVPAGWAMFGGVDGSTKHQPPRGAVRMSRGGAPRPRAVAAAAPSDLAKQAVPKASGGLFGFLRKKDYSVDEAAAPPPPAAFVAERKLSYPTAPASEPPHDPAMALLARQRASGLWDEGADDKAALATARALLELWRLGVTTSHPLHGTQVRKAVTALAALLPSLQQKNAALAEFAAGVAWRVATGPRSRAEVEHALGKDATLSALRPQWADEPALTARLDALAAQLQG